MKKLFISKIFIFTILTLILLGGLFYWFAYRPTQIRHDCSWVERTSNAIPAQPAITKEDVKASQLKYDECIKKDNEENKGRIFKGLFCEVKKESPAIPAKPETKWYEKASQNEYNFCIHEKGLK